jgi:hypothetical protein
MDNEQIDLPINPATTPFVFNTKKLFIHIGFFILVIVNSFLIYKYYGSIVISIINMRGLEGWGAINPVRLLLGEPVKLGLINISLSQLFFMIAEVFLMTGLLIYIRSRLYTWPKSTRFKLVAFSFGIISLFAFLYIPSIIYNLEQKQTNLPPSTEAEYYDFSQPVIVSDRISRKKIHDIYDNKIVYEDWNEPIDAKTTDSMVYYTDPNDGTYVFDFDPESSIATTKKVTELENDGKAFYSNGKIYWVKNFEWELISYDYNSGEESILLEHVQNIHGVFGNKLLVKKFIDGDGFNPPKLFVYDIETKEEQLIPSKKEWTTNIYGDQILIRDQYVCYRDVNDKETVRYNVDTEEITRISQIYETITDCKEDYIAGFSEMTEELSYVLSVYKISSEKNIYEQKIKRGFVWGQNAIVDNGFLYYSIDTVSNNDIDSNIPIIVVRLEDGEERVFVRGAKDWKLDKGYIIYLATQTVSGRYTREPIWKNILYLLKADPASLFERPAEISPLLPYKISEPVQKISGYTNYDGRYMSFTYAQPPYTIEDSSDYSDPFNADAGYSVSLIQILNNTDFFAGIHFYYSKEVLSNPCGGSGLNPDFGEIKTTKIKLGNYDFNKYSQNLQVSYRTSINEHLCVSIFSSSKNTSLANIENLEKIIKTMKIKGD